MKVFNSSQICIFPASNSQPQPFKFDRTRFYSRNLSTYGLGSFKSSIIRNYIIAKNEQSVMLFVQGHTGHLTQQGWNVNSNSYVPVGSSQFYEPRFLSGNPFSNDQKCLKKSGKFSTAMSQSDSSYLSMWKRAREREDAERLENMKLAQLEREKEEAEAARSSLLEQQFQSLLQVPEETRQKVEKDLLIDRAAAALAAVESLLADQSLQKSTQFRESRGGENRLWGTGDRLAVRRKEEEPIRGPEVTFPSGSGAGYGRRSGPQTGPENPNAGEEGKDAASSSPGPNFWTWVPPTSATASSTKAATQSSTSLMFAEPEPVVAELDLRLESAELAPAVFLPGPSLPPLQSLLETQTLEMQQQPQPEAEEAEAVSIPSQEVDSVPPVDWSFLEESRSMQQKQKQKQTKEEPSHGVNPDGSLWWRESGVEPRANGVVCKWSVVRGVSADGSVEWEEKWWEASDSLEYKELGAEKSGRDVWGGVWRETWKESMWQDSSNGLLNMEKSADKWGKKMGSAADGGPSEWGEQWYEHYDAQGRADKWAHKWCQLDKNKALDVGHAHIWHERWGENFDGKGGAQKYSDKWAERHEGYEVWTKWGDKWGEDFEPNGTGQRGGETWWEGGSGERWNKTWGEGHNNSGWVHKYGQSSSGDHWDTHEPEDTWYERHPHFGFQHCFENSRELRNVGVAKRSKRNL